MIAKIKRTAELIAQEEEEEDGPKSKKVKTETEISETDRAKAEIFAVLSSKKVDELKDVLRWNKQIVGGNKDTLLARIIDAKLRGRLGRCPSCLRGRVKLTEEDGGGAYMYCFWVDSNIMISCSIPLLSAFAFVCLVLLFLLSSPRSHCFLQWLVRRRAADPSLLLLQGTCRSSSPPSALLHGRAHRRREGRNGSPVGGS